MASRYAYISDLKNPSLVKQELIDFEWYPGFAASQKTKSIRSLHFEIDKKLNLKALEISSKSLDAEGVSASAFNLQLDMSPYGRVNCVECIFQASKFFEAGGPYLDILEMSPRDAKRDPRLKESGKLLGFKCAGVDWPLEPMTAFYDWLYIQALKQNPNISKFIESYECFTDIEFNHNKSINCQARAAAFYVSLKKLGVLDEVVSSFDAYMDFLQKI